MPRSPRDGPRCTLPPDELAARGRWLLEKFVPTVRAVESLEAGSRYWLDRTPERLRDLADYVAFESGCCPELDFRITARAGDERIALDVTGPGATSSRLRAAVESRR